MNDLLRGAIAQASDGLADAVTWHALQHAAALLAERLSLPLDALEESRLGRPGGGGSTDVRAGVSNGDSTDVRAGVEAFIERRLDAEVNPRDCAHLLGELLDRLLAMRMRIEGAAAGKPSLRRTSGSFYTPRRVCALVVERALTPLLSSGEGTHDAADLERLRICDPAVGGGAFLIECCVALSEAYRSRGADERRARLQSCAQLYGVDLSELAVATTESALWLFAAAKDRSPREVGAHLVRGDALCGAAWELREEPAPPEARRLDWCTAFPEVGPEGFHLVIGNPPWVAFAGRSAQSLSAEWKSYFRRRFSAFSGFPTLQGIFVERAVELSPRGRVALLLPSALADLDGYRAARAALTRTHRVCEPLFEIGQDAFDGVVQPSFVLVAEARSRAEEAEGTDAPWQLAERARVDADLVYAEPPSALDRFAEWPTLPRSVFRELGFQSNRQVSSRLFLRGGEPREPFVLPLLEGRNVREFVQHPPKLFLWSDPAELAKAGSKLRSLTEYAAVDFVVRQTAAITIAARHEGGAFRNSLLAGYAVDDLDADLLVGLLNSTLYRALHLGRQRDARQATFPQVKIGHLRGLPNPPQDRELRERVRRVAKAARDEGGCSAQQRAELDDAVALLFGLTKDEARAVENFCRERLTKSQARKNPRNDRRFEGEFVEPRGIEPLTS